MSSKIFQDGFDSVLLRCKVWIDPPFDATTYLLKQDSIPARREAAEPTQRPALGRPWCGVPVHHPIPHPRCPRLAIGEWSVRSIPLSCCQASTRRIARCARRQPKQDRPISVLFGQIESPSHHAAPRRVELDHTSLRASHQPRQPVGRPLCYLLGGRRRALFFHPSCCAGFAFTAWGRGNFRLIFCRSNQDRIPQ